MKIGDQLEEKYSKESCVVTQVHNNHVVAVFEDISEPQMIHESNYKHYEKRGEKVVND